jgi:hypothetical protein
MNIIIKIENELIIGKINTTDESQLLGEDIITLENPRMIQIVPANKKMEMMLFPLIGAQNLLTIKTDKITYFGKCNDEGINKSYLQATSKLTLIGNVN